MKELRRKFCLGAAATTVMAAYPLTLTARTWPDRPIRLVTPYAPGGTSDLTARLVAEGLGQRLGVNVLVENKPGANTRIATRFVASSAPDGYTLLWCAGTHTTNPAFFQKLEYDTERDFAPIVHAFKLPNVLVVPSNSPASTLSDYLSLAKKDPKAATAAHSGTASAPHLALVMLGLASGISFNEIAYKGDQPAMTELMGSNTAAAMLSIGTPVPQIRAGRLRALAVTGDQRSALLPEVPTFGEAGFPGVSAFAWFGLLSPTGTPRSIVERLNRELNAILQDSHLRERAGASGAVTIGGTPEEFAKFISTDIARWKSIAKERQLEIRS